MDVRCRKLRCKNNKLQTCTLKTFAIDKKAHCSDYEFDEAKKSVDTTKNMFEQKIKFSPFKGIKKFKMHCDASSCIFNKNTDCMSNGLTILNNNETSATCMNYFKE